MDELASKVSVTVCEVKKYILPKFYNKLQSAGGHKCMRMYGPIIAGCFYTTQLLHAVLFFMVFGPALQEKFVDMPQVGMLLQAFGYFLCCKVTYLYYRVNTTSPGVPSKVFPLKNKKRSTAKKTDEKLPIDSGVVENYSSDIAEILRYSQIATDDFETFEQVMSQLPESEGAMCHKCKFVKPIRTHHCSVCNQCVLVMDHHCMWTNNCIGLHNYKAFIQLCGYGQLAAFFTVGVILICEKETAVQNSSWLGFFYFCKMWDLLVGKAMMAFFGWNCYVAFSGLSYLEYKNLLETRAKVINLNAHGKLEPTGVHNQDGKNRVMLKFNYGFSTRHENIVRVLRTNNYILGMLFTDWFTDPRLCFNGTEWSSFYYYNDIQRASQGTYSREEYDRALDEQTIDQT